MADDTKEFLARHRMKREALRKIINDTNNSSDFPENEFEQTPTVKTKKVKINTPTVTAEHTEKGINAPVATPKTLINKLKNISRDVDDWEFGHNKVSFDKSFNNSTARDEVVVLDRQKCAKTTPLISRKASVTFSPLVVCESDQMAEKKCMEARLVENDGNEKLTPISILKKPARNAENVQNATPKNFNTTLSNITPKKFDFSKPVSMTTPMNKKISIANLKEIPGIDVVRQEHDYKQYDVCSAEPTQTPVSSRMQLWEKKIKKSKDIVEGETVAQMNFEMQKSKYRSEKAENPAVRAATECEKTQTKIENKWEIVDDIDKVSLDASKLSSPTRVVKMEDLVLSDHDTTSGDDLTSVYAQPYHSPSNQPLYSTKRDSPMSVGYSDFTSGNIEAIEDISLSLSETTSLDETYLVAPKNRRQKTFTNDITDVHYVEPVVSTRAPISVIPKRQAPDCTQLEEHQPENKKQKLDDIRSKIDEENSKIRQAMHAMQQYTSKSSLYGSEQQVQVTYIMFISTIKRGLLSEELERMARNEPIVENNGCTALARVTIRNIRMPIYKPDKCEQKYIVCMIRHRAQLSHSKCCSVAETSEEGILTFPGEIVVNNLNSDFKLHLEIYCLATNSNKAQPASISKLRTPKKLMQGLQGKGRNLSNCFKDNFTLLATVPIGINSMAIRRFKLHEKTPQQHVVSPVYMNVNISIDDTVYHVSCFLTYFYKQPDTGKMKWVRKRATLSNNFLVLSDREHTSDDDDDNENTKEIINMLDCIDENIGYYEPTFRTCSFAINIIDGEGCTRQFIFSADDFDHLKFWRRALNTCLKNLRSWNIDAKRPIRFSMRPIPSIAPTSLDNIIEEDVVANVRRRAKNHIRSDSNASHISTMYFTPAVEQAEELVNRVLKESIGMVRRDKLPAWLGDNDFLHFGHRPELKSFSSCFKTVFRMHTETGNIWTHMLGCMAFVGIAIYFFTRPNIEVDLQEKIVFSTFFIGAILCLGFSFVFHTVFCHSERVAKFFNKLDYCGIALLTMGSFVPWLYYTFYCDLIPKIIYGVLILILGSSCIIVSMTDKFATAAYRPIRAATYIALGLSGIIPAVHYLITDGFWKLFNEASMGWLLLMAVLYIVGAVIYALRFPERFYPGKCDFFFQSHQIFHIFVIAAAFVHFHGTLKIAKIRLEGICGNS